MFALISRCEGGCAPFTPACECKQIFLGDEGTPRTLCSHSLIDLYFNFLPALSIFPENFYITVDFPAKISYNI